MLFSTYLQDIEYYNKLEDPTDEEDDMLDLAFGLCETWVFLCMDLGVKFSCSTYLFSSQILHRLILRVMQITSRLPSDRYTRT